MKGEVWGYAVTVGVDRYGIYEMKQAAYDAIKNELCAGTMPRLLQTTSRGIEHYYSEPLRERLSVVPLLMFLR